MVTSNVLSKTKVDFAADLKDLYPAVKALNDTKKNFVTSLQILLTFPFPNFGIKQVDPRRLHERVHHLRPHPAPPR